MIALKFKDPVTYYLLRRKGRATSKNVEGAQPPPPDIAARGEATSTFKSTFPFLAAYDEFRPEIRQGCFDKEKELRIILKSN